MISEPRIIFRPSLGSKKSRACKQFLLVLIYHVCVCVCVSRSAISDSL